MNITVSTEASIKDLTQIFNSIVEDNKAVKTFKSKGKGVKAIIREAVAVLTDETTDEEIVQFLTTVDPLDFMTVSIPEQESADPEADDDDKAEAETKAPKNIFPQGGFTVISREIKARPTSSVFTQLAFIINNPTMSVGEVYAAYNRSDLPEDFDKFAAGKNTGAGTSASEQRPSGRPGWINIKTFRVAIERGLITMETAPRAEPARTTAEDQAEAA